MRPVISDPPLCRLSELQDGTYDLVDVALMNDILDVKAENDFRAHEASRNAQ